MFCFNNTVFQSKTFGNSDTKLLRFRLTNQNICDGLAIAIVNENYKIMQLYQPSLSYQRKKVVDNLLSEREKLSKLRWNFLWLSCPNILIFGFDTPRRLS